MPDLFDAAKMPQKGRHIYTVSELTQDIKVLLENTFSEVWVEGEVSGIRRIATGTTFFALKDDSSILKCVLFYSFAKSVPFELKDGLKVICFGHIGVYEKDGQYQLYAERIEPKGIGSLQMALEQLKQKLEKEGLFAAEHKRPIPYLPATIGVATSLSGAAIKDILKVLDRRFSSVYIIIRPCLVQGEGAKEDIAQAVKEFNRFNEERPLGERIDVLIVGRGGGSIEDLWAFNEEMVARAIYDSAIPVISAVGHERDVTIADLVADVRAATPSVAAELVLPQKEDLETQIEEAAADIRRSFSDIVFGLQETLDHLVHRLALAVENAVRHSAADLELFRKKLAILNPAMLIQQYRVRVLDVAVQIRVRMMHAVELKQAVLSKHAEKLENLSPLHILGRGYSITFKVPEATIVKDVASLKQGDAIRTRLHRGEVISRITEVSENGRDKV